MLRFSSRFLLLSLVLGLATAPAAAQGEANKSALKPRSSKPTAEFMSKARALCTKTLSAKEANALISPSFFIEECVSDCVLTGTFNSVDEAKTAYFSAIDRATRAMSEDPRSAERLRKFGAKSQQLGPPAAPVAAQGTATKTLPKPPKPHFESKAREACTKAMNIPEANAILSPKIAIEECIEDTLISGGFDFVEPAKNRYIAAIKRLRRSLDKEPALRGSKAANYMIKFNTKVQTALDSMEPGKHVRCPNNCAGHGRCSPTGCLCDSGWTGPDCTTARP